MDKELAYALTVLTNGLRKTMKTKDNNIIEVPETISIYSYLLKGFELVKLNGEDPAKYLPANYRFLFEKPKEEKPKESKEKK